MDVCLSHGAHESAEQGMCAAELVSYVTREPFSDHPQLEERRSSRGE